MLIEFQTKSYPPIVMFGDIAKKLIKYMGHSGAIPSAIEAEDIPNALAKLQKALKNDCNISENISNSDSNEDNDEENISLDKRAKPLIELLQSAIDEGEYVMWDRA